MREGKQVLGVEEDRISQGRVHAAREEGALEIGVVSDQHPARQEGRNLCRDLFLRGSIAHVRVREPRQATNQQR